MSNGAKSPMETVLHFSQTLAIIAAGCWTIYQYTTFNSKQQELQLQQAALTVKQAELTREFDRAGRVTRQVKIDAFKIGRGCGGRSLYEVTYSLTVTNTSQVTHELSALILDTYLGTPNEIRGDADTVIPLGNPPNRFNAASATAGYVSWSQVSRWGSVSPAAKGKLDRRWPAAPDVQLTPLGGLTGALRPGQAKQFSETFRVVARPRDYIGIYAHYCLNRAKTDDDLVPRWEYLPLHAVETAKDASNRIKLPCDGTSSQPAVQPAQRARLNL